MLSLYLGGLWNSATSRLLCSMYSTFFLPLIMNDNPIKNRFGLSFMIEVLGVLVALKPGEGEEWGGREGDGKGTRNQTKSGRGEGTQETKIRYDTGLSQAYCYPEALL